MRFDRYNAVFSTETTKGNKDYEMVFKCDSMAYDPNCEHLFDDLEFGYEPDGDASFLFNGSEKYSPRDENYSF